ncbi:MAG: hypothetical protein LBQ22_12760 [Bacteroidales bacterium]|jgi:hypothetical protein|nr:hypothetical protein [Bacteroidales bacterium]
MRIYKLFFPVILIFFCTNSIAQEDKDNNIKYSLSVETGIMGNPDYFAYEQTIVNGINIKNKHSLGLGIGVGVNWDDAEYWPLYFNYRYYFKPDKISPHVNFSIGALLQEYDQGFFTSITSGFKRYLFSFSSGIFFNYLPYTRSYAFDYNGNIYYEIEHKERYSVGFIMKAGITF